MKKMKEQFKNLLGEQKEYFKKYSFTFILVAVITLWMVFIGFEPEHVEEFYITMILTTVLVFVIEALFQFKWYRIPMYLIAFVISLLAKEVMFEPNFTQKQGLLIAGLYISAVLIAFFQIIKDSKVTVSQYLSRVFSNNIILGILISALETGISFIVFTMIELLIGQDEIDIYLKVQLLLLGLFIIPAEILCLLNVKKEIFKPFQVLICYVILPIVTIAELVIYLYFFKIFIIREIPSNTIFPIIAALFLFAGPTWIMIQNFKDKNKYIKVNANLIPYSFLPLIGMQLYAVGVRIAEMGLTPERYLGVALIIFEIMAVILTLIKNQKYLNKILLVAVGIVLVVMCIPKINVVDSSWESQLKRLTSVYTDGTKFEELPEESKQKVISSYQYLQGNEEGKKHIPTYIDTAKLEEEKKILPIQEYTEINYQASTNVIPVEGFKKVIRIDFSTYGKVKIDHIDFTEFEAYDDSNINEKIVENVKSFLVNCMNQEEVQSESITLDENAVFWIDNLYIDYIKGTNEISNFNFRGYLLMK